METAAPSNFAQQSLFSFLLFLPHVERTMDLVFLLDMMERTDIAPRPVCAADIRKTGSGSGNPPSPARQELAELRCRAGRELK